MSNLPSILDMAKNKMKHLATFQDDDLQIWRLEQMHLISNYKGFTTDAEIENEDNYTTKEKMLLSRMIVCEAVSTRILENSVGNESGSENTGDVGQRIKKAKADVVEAEFEYERADTILKMNAQGVYDACRREACKIAYSLGFLDFPLCAGLEEFERKITAKPPFIIRQGKC